MVSHKKTLLSPNPLVQYLNKPSEEFTRDDLILFIEDHNIDMVNFRYPGQDGRLKTLNFVIHSREHLEEILTMGERVDGSSLFSHIEAGSSDLYVVPRYKTAFVNPFSKIPSLDILCSFYDKDGNHLESSPEYILQKASRVLKETTGYDLHVMGELEFYLISEKKQMYPSADQKGYHESSPFSKWEDFRREAMLMIAQTGGLLKYGHSEVGNFTLGDAEYEQNELEFSPCTPDDAAAQLLIAKWILRNLAYKYGITVTFAPKITAGKAGSGLHIHTRLMKDGMSQMLDNGRLSEAALRTIAGFLMLAPSLTAFGNTNPTSYFRLVPHQEAPTTICWGDRNRSVLVRVPLGWTSNNRMYLDANPQQPAESISFSNKQTVEFRCPDGSADVYLLLAGLLVAARVGLESEQSLEFARKTYVDVNIFHAEHQNRLKDLQKLPSSCWESAEYLEKQMNYYTAHNVFPAGLLKDQIKRLKNFNDHTLQQDIAGNQEATLKLVEQFFHCG